MKRLALAAFLIVASASMARATCTSPVQWQSQSNPATVYTNMSMTQAGDGGCASLVTIGGILPAAGGVTEGTTFTGLVASAIFGRAQNGERAAVSNGQTVGLATDLYGKLVTSPWANRENMVRGSSSTAGTAATTLIPAQGVGIKIYVTSMQCFRTDGGTAPIFAGLNDTTSNNGTTVALPAGGGSNPVFQTPLVVPANTAFTFAPSATVTGGQVFCNAQGFNGA